jgi:RND family efflux transporter MFP subunit
LATTSSRPAAPIKLPWVLIVLVVAGGAYYIKTQKGSSATTTTTDKGSGSAIISTEPTHSSLLASGYIAAKAPIVLSAKVSGPLKSLKVEAGAVIKQNDIVAQVSDTDARSALALANAHVRDKQRTVARTKKLVAATAATPVQLEQAMGELDIARAEASVAAQKLDDTRIRSPIDGTVLEILIRPGEAVTPAQGVMRIADLNSLRAEVNVAEGDMHQVYIGQNCEIVTEAQRDRKLKGVVREVAQTTDKARGTVEVKVDLERITDGSLKPGMAVQVRFLPKEETPAPDADGSGSGSASGSAADSATGSAK